MSTRREAKRGMAAMVPSGGRLQRDRPVLLARAPSTLKPPSQSQRAGMVLVATTELAGIAQAKRGHGRDGEVGAQFGQRRVLGNRRTRHRERLAAIERQRGSRAHVAERMTPAGSDVECRLSGAKLDARTGAQAERCGRQRVAIARAVQGRRAARLREAARACVAPRHARIRFELGCRREGHGEAGFREDLRRAGVIAGGQGLDGAAADAGLPVRVGVVPAIGCAEQPFELTAAERERAAAVERGAE